ncbi:helix-turn-helix domain-containing protein [Kribbella sp. CA-247076]|uniref:helix-turn-helix domain-containing protein n=1 Tax=Kribbella sp. CA-247076 TaxID=3239941 RepID=UPI003D8E5ECD
MIAELAQRMRRHDASPRTLELLRATVEKLCCQYSRRDAADLRRDAHGWLALVVELLRRPTGLRAHHELLVAGGWLALLAGCVEYDLGLRAAAEGSRTTAAQLGVEAEHHEIIGWSHELTAWFALTQGRLRDAVAAAQIGQAIAQSSSVHAQLIAQEAKAKARLGSTGLGELLQTGRDKLERLPYPDRPDNHFKVDPAKWDYLSMDIHRIAGDNDLARTYAQTVIRDNLASDGTDLSPMRTSECRLTLAFVAAREGDLEQAVGTALDALRGARRSRPHLSMITHELAQELHTSFPGERLVHDFEESLRAI